MRRKRKEERGAMEKDTAAKATATAAAAAASRVCRRCKARYFPSDNTPLSCRFHPSFFVCRRHDDQKRYYELKDGDPPYAARFYDCCGAEDPDAAGCATASHLSYDDPE